MKYKRPLILLLVLSLMLSLFTACGSKDEENSDDDSSNTSKIYNKDGLFSLGYNPEYGLNPYSVTDTNNLMVSSLMYDTVFELDDTFNVSSRIIEDYSTEDGLWWVFTVDTTIPCHDGSTLTAYDVAYSLQKAMSSTMYSSRLSCIYGVSSIDDKTFAISLNYVNTQLPKLLTVPVIKDGSISDDIPCGTGPYVISSAADALVVFEDYYAANMLPIDTIYLKTFKDRSDMISKFEASDIDLIVNEPLSTSPIECKSSYSSFYYNMSNLHFLGFNASSPFFSYTEHRKVMNYAIDRDFLVSDIFDSCALVTTLPVHPASDYYNKELADSLTYDASKVKSSLKDANIQDYDNDDALEYMSNGSVTEIDLNFIVCNSNSKKVYAARQIAENLNELGITVTLNELSWNDYLAALEEGNYDMYYGEIKLNPDFNLSSLLGVDGSSNYFHNDSSSYSSYISNYLSAAEEDRALQADLMYQYIADNAIIVPICFNFGEIIASAGVISDLSSTQYDAFHNIENWTVTLK
ncbi:MAG: ABC transporter substrate-binding protein [Oscillospiraceae bacterium]|jgi:peptide/nickel transport system substrate-binding protein